MDGVSSGSKVRRRYPDEVTDDRGVLVYGLNEREVTVVYNYKKWMNRDVCSGH